MKAVILAAGYGTRLHRDIEKDHSGHFGHLRGVAKPLLPIGDCPLVSHWLTALTSAACVDHVIVVTNALYHDAFHTWAREFPSVQVINDGTRSNEERLGAVACLHLALRHFTQSDDVMVIGGDTLFKEDFSLRRITEHFAELQKKNEHNSLVVSYECGDEETSKYGILELDTDARAQCMKEKPLPTETHSRSACPCFYLFSKTTLPLLDVFLKEKETRPLEERDAPGNFLSWLVLRRPVYVREIAGRFDVGNLASYRECDRYFREHLQNRDLYLI